MRKTASILASTLFLTTLICIASAPVASAQTDRENSTFTVTEPIEVGAFTLQPGTYLIKVVMLEANRSLIQVTNVEQTKVFASVLATPHPIRAEEEIPSSRYIYYTSASGQPKALRTWFAPDTAVGQDIIYPKHRALALAAADKVPVIAIPDEAKEAEYKSVPLAVVTPELEMKPYEAPNDRVAPAPAPVLVAEARPVEQLPKTAGNTPLFAALGFLSLSGALGLRLLTNRSAR